MTINIDNLEKLLSSRLRKTIEHSSLPRAAVLVGMMDQENETHLLLTRRTESVDTHKGQVAFPGGMMEDREEIIETALRESHEEVGLANEDVQVLGLLDDLQTPTDVIITPVIASLNLKKALRPGADEVARIFTVPVAFFTDEKNVRIEQRVLRGIERTVFFYEYDGENIWGVSAYIIRNFIAILSSLSDARK